ncbi:MAG: hypothetical protein IPJ84_09630 [Bdellovibrionales bacterium]|nr:hypothetical protein [Bdellovibrionales bacterium]
MIEVQKQIHGAVLEEEEQKIAEDIAAFNRAHFLARLPVNHYFDKFVVQKLPSMIFDACRRRPGLSVVLGPRAVRIYERYGSASIYFGLRNSIVGE